MQAMSIEAQNDCVVVPASAHTLAGFHAWQSSPAFPERGRIEFCAGELLIDMTPERLDSHNLVKSEIYRALAGLVREQQLGLIFGDGVGFANETADISTEPDGLFISKSSLDSGRARKASAAEEPLRVSGSPDWVLEVVSPSSVQKDKLLWLKKYAEAGVGEYWVVDARGDEIQFDLFVLRPDGLQRLEPMGGWSRSPVFGVDVRLTREPAYGEHVQYTLELRT